MSFLQVNMLSACRRGDRDTVRRLMPAFAVNAFFDARVCSSQLCDARGREDTALLAAAYHGHAALVAALIELGANVDLGSAVARMPPLLVAAECSRIDVARCLLAAHCDVDARDCDNRTALHAAASNGCAELVQLLAAAGASLDACSTWCRSLTPLGASIGAPNCLQVMTVLLDAGASLHGRDDGGSIVEPALVEAASKSNLAAMELLLARGANVDGGFFLTPIAVAFANAAADVCRFLLERGADPSVVGSQGSDVVHLAFRNSCLPLAVAACVPSMSTLSWVTSEYSHTVDADYLAAAKLALAAADASTLRALPHPAAPQLRQFCDDDVQLSPLRRSVARLRLDLVRKRVLQVCVGLQDMALPAFLSLLIVQHACPTLKRCVPLHLQWKLVTTIKHFKQQV
jgi:ankyrin repeat protein